MTYPEHEKLSAVRDKSQAIGEFLDWLMNEEGVSLAIYHEHTEECDNGYLCGYHEDELARHPRTIQDWLAAYFEIDQQKLEEEKRAMLEEIARNQ